MHLASIPAPFVAPLIGIVVGRHSRYLAAHSWQSLYESVALKALLLVSAVGSSIYTLTQIWHHCQNGWQDWNWPAFLIRMACAWLLVVVLGVASTVQAVVAAHRAHAGRWPRRGILQRAVAREG